MGFSGSKQKTSSTSKGTATTTPQAPSWLEGPASNYFGQIGNLLSQNPQGVSNPASQLQTQAFSGSAGMGGFNQALSDAMGGTRGLMNFQPGSVQAGQLADADLNPYMNPYTQNVIDTSLNDLDRFRQGAISGNQASATRSGAYGGSRHGVADAETNRGFLDQAGSLVANLRNTGFQNAQQGAMFDINNRMGADQFNVNAGLQGAQFRGNMANQLGQQGMAQDANSRATIDQQATLGAQQRDIANQNDPTQMRIQQLSQIAQLLGINPSAFIGQNINSTGTQTGTQTSTPGFMDILGPILQAGGTIAASDRRLKREIVALNESINGTPLYEFSYLWDEPGVRHVGVMAQEAPAHAVIHHPSGYLMVDYGKL
jgi:hypothetical protein